jgi:hypothetical protein
MRDTYVLARTAYETLLNVCYVVAEGDDAADRAYKHALQKSWRDLDRRLVVNGETIQIRYEPGVDLDPDSEIQEAIDEFTTRQGTEVTSWTPASVRERIVCVDAKYGRQATMGLRFGLLAIYRHASDISHGTLFSAMFAVGLTNPSGPPASPAALMRYQRENLCMLLTILGGVVDSVLQVLSREVGGCAALAKKSSEAISALREVPWIM